MDGWQEKNQDFISDPWLSIWRSPRETMREILDLNPRRHVQLLAVLAGFVEALEWATEQNFGDRFPLAVVLLICAATGAAGGVAFLYGGGWLMHRIGAYFSGKGTYLEIRAAMAWSTVPMIWTLLFWLPVIGIFGNALFQSQNLDLPDAVLWVAPLVVVAIAGIAIAIWTIYIFINCLAEAHRFSLWHALLTAVVGLVIYILVAIAVAIPVELLTG